MIEGTGTRAGPQVFGSVTDDGANEVAGRLVELADAAVGVVNGLAYDRVVLRAAIEAALERLDASLFTNAEHSQAKEILRNALKEGG